MPEPRLQTDPPDDLAKLRTREEKELNTYHWVDRDKGVIHVPIEKAIDQYLAQQQGKKP